MKIYKIVSIDDLIPILSDKNGGLFDMPDEMYHSKDCPGMSRSSLNEFAKSGEHYQYSRIRPREATDAMKLGSAFHISILQPQNLQLMVGVLPKFKGVKGNTIASQTDAYLAGRSDRMYITKDQLDTLQRMTMSIATHPLIKELRACQHIEVAAFAKDPASGELLKCKPDAFCISNNKIKVYDLKSTRKGGGTYHEFLRQVTNKDSRLYIQAAMYSYVLKLVTGLDIDSFKFVVVEKDPPYPVSCFELSSDFLDFAYDEMTANLEDFAICKKRNIWPGYPTGTQVINLPRWMIRDE